MSGWTPEREAAARGRCEKATPGPWRAVRYLAMSGKRYIADTSDITAEAHGGTEEEGLANAKFVAHARADLPDALEEIERLREALENVLESAYPHPIEHPTMTEAWKRAREALGGER